MQYSKGRAMPIAWEERTKIVVPPMLRLRSKLAAFVIVVLSALALAGCSDSLTGTQPPPNFAKSLNSYDKTLTPEQQKAAIADLQNAQAKNKAPGEDTTAEKPAQSQN